MRRLRPQWRLRAVQTIPLCASMRADLGASHTSRSSSLTNGVAPARISATAWRLQCKSVQHLVFTEHLQVCRGGPPRCIAVQALQEGASEFPSSAASSAHTA